MVVRNYKELIMTSLRIRRLRPYGPYGPVTVFFQFFTRGRVHSNAYQTAIQGLEISGAHESGCFREDELAKGTRGAHRYGEIVINELFTRQSHH